MNSLLLTVAALRMLVPRTVVADVLGASLLEFQRDEASRVVFINWRSRRVPVLGAAMIGAVHGSADIDTVGEASGDGAVEESKVAIFHGLKHPQHLPYYAFVTTRNPRLLRVGDEDLEEVTDVQLHPAELMRIRVDGVEACIPRIDYFENTLVEQMRPAAGQ